MAKELLPDQELNNSCYTVVKTLNFSERGGTYLIRRTEDKTRLILKEIIPSSGLSEEEFKAKLEDFENVIQVLFAFEHPNLTKVLDFFTEKNRVYVVMERIEGITLQELTDMSVNPHPEKQVLEWAITLCDAISYMHNRPRPFTFSTLDASNIMVTPEKQLKIISYGLHRFFDQDYLSDTAPAAVEIAKDIQRFGEMMVFLLTKSPPGPLGLTQQHKVSPQLAKVINRCLTGDYRRTYSSFEELAVYLDRVLNPPPPIEKIISKKKWFKSVRWDFSYYRWYQAALWKFMKQPLWVVALEMIGLLSMLGLFYRWLNPPVYERTEEAVYIACGNTINVMSIPDHHIITKIHLPEPAAELASTPAGDRLFVSTYQDRRILVYHGITNHLLGFIPVDRNPRKMVVDPKGEYLFIAHPDTGQVGTVKLSRQIPDLIDKDHMMLLKDYRLIALMPGGGKPTELGLDPGPPKLQNPLKRAMRLFVSDEEDNQVLIFDPITPKKLFQFRFTTPGAILLTSAPKRLFIASHTRNKILIYKPLKRNRFKRIKTLKEIGGENPVAILIRPKTKELWCINGSGSVGIISLKDYGLRKTISLGGTPSAATFVQDTDKYWLWVLLSDKKELVIIDPGSRIIDERIALEHPPTGLLVLK